MLTESEKHWLRNKRLKGFRYDICRWCFAYPVASWERAPSPCLIYCHDNGVPALCEGLHSVRGLKDALEFSERVAAKLATIIPALTKDNPWPNILWPAVTPDKALKWAMLKVEEEMDNEP